MGNLIFRGKVIYRFFFFSPFAYNLIYFIFCFVSKKNRTGIGISKINMIHAVLFFIFPGILMFLNFLFEIIINRNTDHQSGLSPSFHYLSINIDLLLLIL